MQIARRIHFMGTEYARQTACGRYVDLTAPMVLTSAVPAEVTCQHCIAAIA